MEFELTSTLTHTGSGTVQTNSTLGKLRTMMMTQTNSAVANPITTIIMTDEQYTFVPESVISVNNVTSRPITNSERRPDEKSRV